VADVMANATELSFDMDYLSESVFGWGGNVDDR
jgi:hypothetical protein